MDYLFVLIESHDKEQEIPNSPKATGDKFSSPAPSFFLGRLKPLR